MLQGGHEKVNGQTDRRTDGQTDRQTGWIQYTPPNFVAGGIKIQNGGRDLAISRGLVWVNKLIYLAEQQHHEACLEQNKNNLKGSWCFWKKFWTRKKHPFMALVSMWITKSQTTKKRLQMVSTQSFWHISLVFHIRASYQLPSPSFHDNRASYSRDTIWPRKLKVKGKGQRHPSQRSVQLTHFLGASHQGIL